MAWHVWFSWWTRKSIVSLLVGCKLHVKLWKIDTLESEIWLEFPEKVLPDPAISFRIRLSLQLLQQQDGAEKLVPAPAWLLKISKTVRLSRFIWRIYTCLEASFTCASSRRLPNYFFCKCFYVLCKRTAEMSRRREGAGKGGEGENDNE